MEHTLRLFCFPYAGGSARSIFRSWRNSLPEFIDVCPIELPGRGSRIAEPLCTSLHMLLDDLILSIMQQQDKPFALFGHSLGSLLSFELVRQLKRRFSIDPICLFVSAYGAPHLPRKSEPIHLLPDPEFLERLYKFNGTPKEVLCDTAIMQLMIPILRSDFSVAETYQYVPESSLDCSIIAYGGLKDNEVGISALEAWRTHTSNIFSLRILPGDHFFLHTQEKLLLQDISQELMTYRPY